MAPVNQVLCTECSQTREMGYKKTKMYVRIRVLGGLSGPPKEFPENASVLVNTVGLCYRGHSQIELT